ncbi:KPN_02809 family neutral zinc metallopeptidase [Yoonia sediminilitoris]|uniref:Metalloprotease n=1 Tax=Yoonia sediminilitoris TaxID=1286148 RepID=A0A2T6KD33_9RHOB|nr:neutral zinc metallopeptidase [Yoonia sediminilitoris]PUB12808.1 hypothetical protein C8N45_109118 [Yoonia sediminilitoris]RCW94287.1 hypothetical protein DFP92_109118 [Yoonia sediminilitoris]
MKWQGRRGSSNIEDRRKRRGGGVRISGVGGIAGVLLLVAGWYFGVDTSQFVNLGDQQFEATPNQQITAADAQAGEFVAVTLADTEAVWADVFTRQLNRSYRPPTLVLFKGRTESACGGASAATGPFYCPPERKAYLDTEFFVTLSQRMGAGGDFAAAYVVAHEVAHHVQNELGILQRVNELRGQLDQEKSNALSVRVELQADCLSGIWARLAAEKFDSLEPGDIAEAMNAAAQIGDDTLQRNAGQAVRPHTFTHGTSAQRQRWFARGLESGNLDQCDTFSAAQL